MYPSFRYLKTWFSGIYTDVCYITKRITRLLWYESDTNSVDLIVDDCRHCASFIIIQGRKPVICLGLDIFPQTNDLLQIYYRLSFEPITDLPLQCSLCTVITLKMSSFKRPWSSAKTFKWVCLDHIQNEIKNHFHE